MFTKYRIDLGDTTFQDLKDSINFEEVGDGKSGTNLVDVQNEKVPIVRTTTPYQKPAQRMSNIHYWLRDQIKNQVSSDLEFNNIMSENYDNRCRKMKYHSDQAQDLDNNSYIGVFSCYDDAFEKNMAKETKMPRTLKVKPKGSPEEESFSISMDNNSFILFSVANNREYVHKIIQENPNSTNQWLGLTFRLSKTFVYFDDNYIPRFVDDDQELRLATDEEKPEMFKSKGQENHKVDFTYPEMNFTLSPSDRMPPEA